MRRIFLTLSFTAATLLLGVNTGLAQEKSKPTEEHGWASSWTMPVTEAQRKNQEFLARCNSLNDAGKFQQVVELCSAEIQRQPKALNAYGVRAVAYAELKKYDLANADITCAKELINKGDNFTAKTNVLLLQAKLSEYQGDYRGATENLREALKLDRTNTETLNSLAWLLATAPDNSVRNGREAVSLAKKAVASTLTDTPCAATDTLAAAYAEINDFTRAVDTEKRALEAVQRQIRDAARLAKFQREANARLRLYEGHQPYRLASRP